MSKILTKCINKHRDKSGSILYYTLTDKQGQKKNFTGQQIKDYIRSGQLEVINLQIDKLGRLVDKAEQQAPAPQKAGEEKITEARLVKALVDIVDEAITHISEQEAKRHLDIARNLISKYNGKYKYSENKNYLELRNNRTELYLNNELIEKSNGQRIRIYVLKIACGLLGYNLIVSMGTSGNCKAGVTLLSLDSCKLSNMYNAYDKAGMSLAHFDTSTSSNTCTAYDKVIAKGLIEVYRAFHGIKKESEEYRNDIIDMFKDNNNETCIRVGNSTIKLGKASIKNTDNVVAIIWWLKGALESIGYDLWYGSIGINGNGLVGCHACITERNSLVGRIAALKWYAKKLGVAGVKYMRKNGLKEDISDDELEELTIKKDILMDGGFKVFDSIYKPIWTILENKNINIAQTIIEQ